VDDLMWLAILLGMGAVGFAYIRLLGVGDEGADA
jgi:hypothetical protein